MTVTTRLRQVALVARELEPVAKQLQQELDLPEPFHDPGVGEFGLENSVFAAGDTFIEIVAPVKEGTTAGRLLDKRGGDGGYMAIFQVPDLAAARARVDELGITVVWKADLEDIAGTHLHPRDVPGAIVSLDWTEPAESWRWAGPQWIGRANPQRKGSITGATISGGDHASVAKRWADVLSTAARPEGDDFVIDLDSGRQTLRFTAGDHEPAITRVGVAMPATVRAGRASVDVCGITFDLTDEEA